MTIKVAPKKLIAFKQRIKELTGRSRGISMERRLTDLNRYVRGWVGYFGLARQFEDIANLDGWIRRRIRMCYWKQWRLARTKVKNLVALGVSLDMAIKHAISRKKYWRMSRTPALRYAQQVACATRLTIIKATLVRVSFSSRNRLVRTRMLGGVGAAVSNGGGYPISPSAAGPIALYDGALAKTLQ